MGCCRWCGGARHCDVPRTMIAEKRSVRARRLCPDPSVFSISPSQISPLTLPREPATLLLLGAGFQQSQRQANCSLESRKLPPCNPWHGAWRRGACCLAPASAPRPSRFSPPCCAILFPQRPIVVVTEGLKTQESAQQDLATWLAVEGEGQSQKPEVRSQEAEVRSPEITQHVTLTLTPHASLRSSAPLLSRLGSPAARSQAAARGCHQRAPGNTRRPHATRSTQSTLHAPLIVTSVVALLQRTFPAGTVRERTRTLTRGDRSIRWTWSSGSKSRAMSRRRK